jgi:hypothetical protein
MLAVVAVLAKVLADPLEHQVERVVAHHLLVLVEMVLQILAVAEELVKILRQCKVQVAMAAKVL